MITVGLIRSGATYLSQHLQKNDYWQEGEKQVLGKWIGRGAELLNLRGTVEEKAFEALRQNRHPVTGKRLTARDSEKRVAFFDIQLSAPKDVSVLALVGDDGRVRAAFCEAAETALGEMERYAAVRERRGRKAASEEYRLTGNYVGALFVHDASRDLDPQLHVHAVLANATWDAERSRWLALKQTPMLRASPYFRQVFYRELAGRLRGLGYEPYGMTPQGFSIRGVEHLRERFSKRARHVQTLANEFAQKKGRRPTKREVEVLVRESRSKKLASVSTTEVRARQRAELTSEERRGLANLVSQASERPRQQVSLGQPLTVLKTALRHVFERKSVVQEGEVLAAALELHPDFYRWRELQSALVEHRDLIRFHGELSLRSILREEDATVRRTQDGRNTRFALGSPEHLPEDLTRGQRKAAKALLLNKDFVSVLIGDAGTGKTRLLTALESAHRAKGGEAFIPLAPTTRARDALLQSGFEGADTVQRFLVSHEHQARAARRLILVDEAALLSTEQLARLTSIALDWQARVLLVGDAKQHYSIQRGDALRNVVQRSDVPVVRLSEVLRQREEPDRHFSRLLANGDAAEAFDYANRRGMVRETGDDETLFSKAAEHYAENRARNVETLVVIPFWEEIRRFNEHARTALRRRGLLGETEVVREAVEPLAWTEEQKAHWGRYQVGDRLLFVRNTRFARQGSAAGVQEILPYGLRAVGGDGRTFTITRKQRGAFDVGRAQTLPLAVGDRLLIRGHDKNAGLANGDFREVARVESATGEVVFADGLVLPREFKAWTYGHAVTSYRAQGSTAEESLLVLGQVAERALLCRQFYVGNTRFRGAHRIYVANSEAIRERLAFPDLGRESASEFEERMWMNPARRIATRHLRRLGMSARLAWLTIAHEWHQRQVRDEVRQRMDL